MVGLCGRKPANKEVVLCCVDACGYVLLALFK